MILNILIISVVILFIEIYSETHLKNYGRFIERSVYLLSIKTIFNLVKLTALCSAIFIFFDLSTHPLISRYFQGYLLYPNSSNFYYYFIPSIIFALLAILSNSKELFRQLEDYAIDNPTINKIVANFKYIVFRIISFAFTFIIFKYTFLVMCQVNEILVAKNLYLFDWLDYSSNGVDNYNRGVYISLLLTLILFFLFNNSFIKKNSGEWQYREIRVNFINYFFVTIILSVGLFFGFFSFFNGLYNLFNSGFEQWITKENIVGILPIRISSFLILYYLLTFIYNEVINKDLKTFLLIGVLPIRNIKKYVASIYFEKRETLFFAQISFYIINLALAEFFIIIGYKHIYLSILNFSILFILDDFKIINDYSEGLKRVMPSHFRRIWFVNACMFLIGFTVLMMYGYHLILCLYVVLTFILAAIYYRNYSLINFKR